MSETNQQPYYDDEIDLRELILVLVEGWYWIAGAVIAAGVLALAYVSMKTPTYETQFKAVPAPEANFSGFDLLGNGFAISPKEAYRNLGNELSSYQNFKSFYEQNRDDFVTGETVDLASLFAGRFAIKGLSPEGNDSSTLSVQYKYPEGERGSEIVNAYMQFTAENVWENLRRQFHEYNRAQIARLETELDLQRESLRSAREDRLFTLEQAISVARRLEIKKPTTPQQFGRQPSGTEVFYANISGDGSLPLYFMGYQALEADRDSLKEVLDDSLSNSAIRGTEQQLKQHKRIAELLDNESLRGVDEGIKKNDVDRVVQVVEEAFEPSGPSEPKKLLIMVIALMLGGMLGVVLAFLAKFAGSFKGYRERKQES